MKFRQALPHETELLFIEGYKQWPKNRSFEQYCADNAKEDAYGKRYVLDADGRLVSSLILLDLKEVAGKKAYGIGSVLTPKEHGGKGFATKLLNYCINLIAEDAYLFLFSDIDPAFYVRLGFTPLPPQMQKYPKSVCMVYCSEENRKALDTQPLQSLPDYF